MTFIPIDKLREMADPAGSMVEQVRAALEWWHEQSEGKSAHVRSNLAALFADRIEDALAALAEPKEGRP